jgi:T-complex protein 1 subunit theta
VFQDQGAEIKDVAEAGIFDLFLTKFWALTYATHAACTILRIDQIIMAKRAGGPKPPSGGGAGGAGDDDD